ncbi:hypothetical protein [Lentibacillus populi]|nr:hypothetical protein [Lentibacillus populi]
MTYHINLIKLLFSMDDHLYRINKAEKIQALWKWCSLLCLFSIIIYGWMALLGIGSDFISSHATALNATEYELSKLGFVIGRGLYAILLTAIILFLSALIFYSITGIPFRKLIIMQQVVLLMMLVERVLWIPLMLYWGLDWYVSPLSFGIIASYFTEYQWIIYFFGAISLFQLWIIGFQVKFLRYLSPIKRRWIWLTVILLHIFYWAAAASLALIDNHLVRGWFG